MNTQELKHRFETFNILLFRHKEDIYHFLIPYLCLNKNVPYLCKVLTIICV